MTMSGNRAPEEKAAQWQFLRQSEAWVWRKLRADGTIVSASGKDFGDYAFAVTDAINHGFRPRKDYWLIDTDLGTTHFRHGEMPVFISRKDGDAAPRPDNPQRAPSQPEAQASASNSRVEQ